MTYFWICVSAWLSLNGTVVYVVIRDMVADKRKSTGGVR